MSFRINTNTQSAFALSALNKTSNEIGLRQTRLATGSRINSAADDSAGFTIANKLSAKTRGQAQALSNIGDAKSMLSVAEGSLGATMDILQTMKEKAIQAGNSSMNTEERTAIQSQVDALAKEVNDILTGAEFNGKNLFSSAVEGTQLTFQVGDESGDTFEATISTLDLSTLGLGTVDGDGALSGGLALDTDPNVATALTAIDGAIDTVNTIAAGIGDSQNRLNFKAQNLETSMNNYDAARSRIADADFAKEQMELVKLQILQQTGSAMFAQSNAAPQSVLSFF